MSYVIYNTVNQPALKERQKDCFSKKNFNVLMVCSLKAYKGVYEFISLANLLSEFTAFNFILVLNASGEEIAKTLNKPLPENLKLFSRQSNLKPFYQDASVVLSLSRPDGWIETFGLTIVEAMSYSIPVIVPTVGGPAEIVVDGVDGYQISCYELDKIQAKLIELYRDTEQYHRVSKAAYDKSKEFDIDVFKQKMLEVIND